MNTKTNFLIPRIIMIKEPGKNFDLKVERISDEQYNLTCRADELFPKPTIGLFRYRAGPLMESASSASARLQSNNKQRARFAATLRQEPISGAKSEILIRKRKKEKKDNKQLIVSSLNGSNESSSLSSLNDHDLAKSEFDSENINESELYEASSWALVDESSLSSSVVTQFECLLSIEGTNYQVRQSLALQRGK